MRGADASDGDLRTRLWPRYLVGGGVWGGVMVGGSWDAGRVGWLGPVDRGGAGVVASVVVAVR